MSQTVDQHRELLMAAITASRPSNEVKKELRKFAFDRVLPLAILKVQDVRRVIEAFQAGTMAAEEVEGWANLLEGRDDIGMENGREKVLQEAIFRLANPVLEGSLNYDLGEEIKSSMS